MKKGFVSLTGAGCGTADWITVKGLRALRDCDAVVYDALIDTELLLEAGDAELIPVGKRAGKPSPKQKEINEILVTLASQGKRVVRLKGGDPYVFGRGGEEAEALMEAGIPFEVIPGISSSIAVPGLLGIPVTHRSVSRSFHVITAHTDPASRTEGSALTERLETLAKEEGTLVFLMGLAALPEIAEKLIAYGKDGATPAAVLSGGAAPERQVVRAPLSEIAEKVKAAELVPPAVILIGQTAAMDLSSEDRGPLYGKRIGLTGTQGFRERLKKRLINEGAIPVTVQETETEPLSADLGFLSEGKKLVVLTSVTGVSCFFDALRTSGDLRILAGCRFAVIGGATFEALKNAGIRADLCPEVYTSEALAELIIRDAKRWNGEEEIVLFRAESASPYLKEALTAAGLKVKEIAAYRLRNRTDRIPYIGGTAPKLDALLFGSGSGVGYYLENYGELPEGTPLIAIGPPTEKELLLKAEKQNGDDKDISRREIHTAKIQDADGMIACLKEVFEGKNGTAAAEVPSETEEQNG